MVKRNTWILLIVFAVMLAVTIFWQRSQQSEAAKATPTGALPLLFDAESSKIIGLRISTPDGKTIEIRKDVNGKWFLADLSGQSADNERIQTAIDNVSSIREIAQLEKSPDLKAIGLDPARYEIILTMEGGQQQRAEIGSLTPTKSGYYASLKEGSVLVVDSYGIDDVLGFFDNPPILSTSTPAATSSQTPPG